MDPEHEVDPLIPKDETVRSETVRRRTGIRNRRDISFQDDDDGSEITSKEDVDDEGEIILEEDVDDKDEITVEERDGEIGLNIPTAPTSDAELLKALESAYPTPPVKLVKEALKEPPITLGWWLTKEDGWTPEEAETLTKQRDELLNLIKKLISDSRTGLSWTTLLVIAQTPLSYWESTTTVFSTIGTGGEIVPGASWTSWAASWAPWGTFSMTCTQALSIILKIRGAWHLYTKTVEGKNRRVITDNLDKVTRLEADIRDKPEHWQGVPKLVMGYLKNRLVERRAASMEALKGLTESFLTQISKRFVNVEQKIENGYENLGQQLATIAAKKLAATSEVRDDVTITLQ